MIRLPRILALGAAAALILAELLVSPLAAHELQVRRRLRIPDIPGFRTLQCDFHIHTVFSDGGVWPDIRSEEAWREGLDAIAITDHVEYQPHKADVPTNHERSWEIAQEHGERLGLMVIRGSEITRRMPPGHLNAIFLQSVTPLDTASWREALRNAKEQGAFVFWNHPGWKGHHPDGDVCWYAEHQEIFENGLLDGIEVVNAREYYPEAHRLSLEKNLTPLANSDIHLPVNLDYHVHAGDHRPVTLVFARKASVEGIREALFARRSVAFSGEMLVGREELLRPLVDAALTLENPRVRIVAGRTAYLRIRNDSDLNLTLEGLGSANGLLTPKRVELLGRATSLLEVKAPRAAAPLGRVRLEITFTITNARTSPDAGLKYVVTADVEVVPPP